jgi:hypothetical protein
LAELLTDKQKLNIIESFKTSIEHTADARIKDPDVNVISPKLQFQKDQFVEMDRIWLSEILDHLGVKHEYL